MERERARLRVCRGRADPSFRQAGARFVRLRFWGWRNAAPGARRNRASRLSGLRGAGARVFGAARRRCGFSLLILFICMRGVKMAEGQDGNASRRLVGVVMGSDSDWEVMGNAARVLRDLGVECETLVVSAHRMPDEMFRYAETARSRGVSFIIAGAGGAAHLPGMLAAKTAVPVLGVPVPSKYLRGFDSLLSIVQMPKGIPVATFAIGESGAANAALFAAQCLALDDPQLRGRLEAFRAEQTRSAASKRVSL